MKTASTTTRLTTAPSQRTVDSLPQPTRAAVRGASSGTRSGWGDLSNTEKAEIHGSDDSEQVCRRNRILKAHQLALERETKALTTLVPYFFVLYEVRARVL